MLTERTNKALDGISKCSINGKTKVQDLFEIIVKHTDLWMQAYANIYSNDGATTKGVDSVTQDGFSDERVKNLIKLLKEGRYFPKPSRRSLIPKANGKMRPISSSSGDDKLVQEVVRMILEAIYDPIFSRDSHGFRPNHSCHTALESINTWTGAIWFIEFDIKDFFCSIEHKTLIKILQEKIDDVRFIQIINRMLRAGYVEQWNYNRTYSGVPQGSIVSPILANIYLSELDKFVQNLDYNKGKARNRNPEYNRISVEKSRLRKQIKSTINQRVDSTLILSNQRKLTELGNKQRSIPSKVSVDPNFRRLWYCRYADDFLLGLISPKEEAKIIKDKIEHFLKDNLNLELSAEKTDIKHAKVEGTTFLGYNIVIANNERQLKIKQEGSYCVKRTIKGTPTLCVPKEKTSKFCASKGYGQWETMKSFHRPQLLQLSDIEIISTYNAELRGFANYYAMAKDVKTKLSKLFYIAYHSLVKTLANKHKTSTGAIWARLKANGTLSLGYIHKGKAKELRLFKLSELKLISKRYNKVDIVPYTHMYSNGTELLRRWNAQECDICRKDEGYFEVHHIRKLKDTKDSKQKWQKLMIARKRKTLVLCVECHHLLHAGKLPDWRFKDNRMESRMP
jgi:group II intron reverse transcriptase/maturase